MEAAVVAVVEVDMVVEGVVGTVDPQVAVVVVPPQASLVGAVAVAAASAARVGPCPWQSSRRR
jgi:hypothetical protein